MPARPHFRLVLLLLVCICLNAHAENLLANPGFEKLNATIPENWDLFVMPYDGVRTLQNPAGKVAANSIARGKVTDKTSHEGRYSVFLETLQPYKRDPLNNWSQCIVAELAGKELTLRAAIKTENASEAAIWLQAWDKQSWGALSAVSTSREYPMYGTKDWTVVEAKMKVPVGTDFIVCRCILRGTGKAWFDDVIVDDGENLAPIGEVALDDENKDDGKKVKDALGSHDRVTDSLLKSQEAMIETNRMLRETNEMLADQIRELMKERRVMLEKPATSPSASEPKTAKKHLPVTVEEPLEVAPDTFEDAPPLLPKSSGKEERRR